MCFLAAGLGSISLALPGRFSGPRGDAGNGWDAPIPGFVGPDGDGVIADPDFFSEVNVINPRFVGWAASVAAYVPSGQAIQADFADPSRALGPVTGNHFNIVSLGDVPTPPGTPGSLTLGFDPPIGNGEGPDFAVFENGFVSMGGTGVAGQIFGELCFVEVSSDGVHFARFPSRGGQSGPVGAYGTIDATRHFGLAGKHVNSYATGESWGTPFDLEWLHDHPLILSGLVDRARITHIRLVDVVGSGHVVDSCGQALYDPWLTFGSGGADIEAVGVLHQHPVVASPPLLQRVWSRQGGYDVRLRDLCREEIDPRAGAGGAVVLQFDRPVEPGAGFAVSLSSGTFAGVSAENNLLILTYSDLPDGACAHWTVGGVRAPGGMETTLPIRFQFCRLVGDVTRSGAVGMADVAALVDRLGGPASSLPEADLHPDGAVDRQDLALLLSRLGSVLP